MHKEALLIASKTNPEYWNRVWGKPSELKLPSRLLINNLNVMRLLKSHIKPGSRYIEIGCAPGKMLAWVAKVLGANATGLDYSEVGIARCKDLCEALSLKIDFHCQDFSEHNLQLESFDYVTSFGLIEHFDDPTLLVKWHVDLLKPGGLALITISNYDGFYGLIQKWCDPANIALHNLNIMTPVVLKSLVNNSEVSSVKAYHFGKIDPLILSLEKKMQIHYVKIINIFLNGIGILQPMVFAKIAPMLVLEVRK